MAAPAQVSDPTRSEPNEMIQYVLMPLQTIRTFTEEINF